MFVINNIAYIDWGTGYANRAIFAFPADDCATYVRFNEDFELGQSLGGTDISYIMGNNGGDAGGIYGGRSSIWEGTIRWIPAEDTATATGWNGATGIRAMLEWAQRKNPLQMTFKPFRVYNQNVFPGVEEIYLESPLDGSHDLEPDGSRSIRLTLKNANGLLFNGNNW